MARLTETMPTLRCPANPTHLRFIRFEDPRRNVVDEHATPVPSTAEKYYCETCGQLAIQSQLLMG